MKAVLISIQPKWCELIASGKKTFEVRKTKPKLETPFKVYIYQTLKPVSVMFHGTGGHISEYDKTLCYNKRSGKVIGEFVCDSVDDMPYVTSAVNGTMIPRYVGNKEPCTCLSEIDIFKYGRGNLLYDWHISDLIIYDEPKELSEFLCKCNKTYCTGCEDFCDEGETSFRMCGGLVMVKRPPQSWCYVEEGE